MKRWMKYLIAGSLLIVIFLVSFLTFLHKKINENDFRIHVFSIGKADAILISKEDHHILIDTGEEEDSDEVLEYLKKNDIKELDYLIITHFDKDHVGGAASIINEITVNNIIQGTHTKESDEYQKYLRALSIKKKSPKLIINNFKMNFYGVDVLVNSPTTVYDKNESNNSSLIVSMTYGKYSYLFMGDAENQRINDWVKTNDKEYTFVKMPYHGNYQKRLEDLLNSIKPKYAVATCSKNAGCEEKTLDLLKKYKVKTYLTRDGEITLYSDGKKIKIEQR